MTTIAAPETNPSGIRPKQPVKKDYYDIIAGLSAFEKSQDVVLTKEELIELTTADEDKKEEKKEEEENLVDEKKEQKEQKEQQEPQRRPHRQNLHSYLGGKVDMQEVQTAQHNLSHTLLGAYVPKKQLESLSSLDFAHYFHKALECEESLQIYDLFIQPTQNKIQNSILLNNAMNNSISTPGANESDPEHNPKVYQWTKPDGKIVKKVVICNRCNAKFSGQNRMKQLAQHHCKGNPQL